LAGELGDGLISTSPQREVVQAFDEAGGRGKPRYGQVTVCWAPDEASARKTALHWWPTAAVQGQLSQELALPEYFEAASASVTEDQIAEMVVCGPDPQKHIEKIQKYIDAGFDHVYLHQVGPEQAGFMEFCRREILPHFGVDLEQQPAAA
jgi:G6PDH family F420-dependent oxidoreductase